MEYTEPQFTRLVRLKYVAPKLKFEKRLSGVGGVV
jgi:hypothetical protein